MSAAPGKTVHVRLRCEGEESLVRLLSRLEVIQLLAMLYEYGSSRSMSSRAYDAVIIVSRGDEADENR